MSLPYRTPTSSKRPRQGDSDKSSKNSSPARSESPEKKRASPERSSARFRDVDGNDDMYGDGGDLLDNHQRQSRSRLSNSAHSRPVSRQKSAKSLRPQSGVTDNGQESEGGRTQASSEVDVTTMDINDDAGWDTDLEQDDAGSTYDHSGKTTYIEACKKLGVVPVSYFLRHMNDADLQLKHHGLGPIGMKAVAASLVSNTTVLKLDLSDNWLGFVGGHAVCEMLKENCFITDLNLSDNKLGSEIAEQVADIMTNSNTLTHINLSGNEFDDRAAVFFADAILNTTKIEALDLSHNQFGEDGGVLLGPAISENSSIKVLDLSWNSIRRKGAVAVAVGIKNNIFLRKVDLSWNGFGNEGAIALGDALKANSVLEELDISNNRINTEGAVLFGKGMNVNETLKVLKMGQNPMQSAGCYAICAAMLKNPNCIIERLDFSRILVNEDFEEQFKQLKEMLPEIKCRHGGDDIPKRPEIKIHPMVKLANYIEENNLRMIDFFMKFDDDRSMSVTREEFAQGIVDNDIPLSEDEIQILLNELDKDGDGEVNYRMLENIGKLIPSH